jgi:raffinose/stachyose/melibiose transport system permease protein
VSPASRRKRIIPALFLAPAMLLFISILLVPVVAVVVLGFTGWTGFDIQQISFEGARNYRELTRDSFFIAAFLHTLVLITATAALMNGLGIAAAMVVNSRVRGSEFLRIAMFLPLGLSPIITAVIWQRMLGPFGIVNEVLGRFGISPIDFFGQPRMAFGALIAAYVWQYTGYNMLLYYAALQSLPIERIEAAAVDGASKWRQFRHVVLPFLRPVVAVVVILNLIGGWKIFDIVYVLTGGGPNRATDVLATYLYEQSFTFSNVGYASAIGTIIIGLAIVSSLTRRALAGSDAA